MDGGAWWATVHGVAKSWTRLSDFTSLHFIIILFNHLINCPTAFQSDCIIWYFPVNEGFNFSIPCQNVIICLFWIVISLWFWSAILSCLMILIYSCTYCHFYIFFGKISIHIICPVLIVLFLFIFELYKLSTSLTDMLFANYSPILWVVFHFLDGILWEFFILMMFNLFFICKYRLLLPCLRNHYIIQDYEYLCLY